MKPIKILTITAIIINVLLLSFYKQHFGVKTISGMVIISAIAGTILYNEIQNIKRGWSERERRLLTGKMAELSLAALMTSFAGLLLFAILIHKL